MEVSATWLLPSPVTWSVHLLHYEMVNGFKYINLSKTENMLSHVATTDGRLVSQTVLIKMNLNVVWRSNSHPEVNTLRLCYKNLSVFAV